MTAPGTRANASRRWTLPFRRPVPTRNSRKKSHLEREACRQRSTISSKTATVDGSDPNKALCERATAGVVPPVEPDVPHRRCSRSTRPQRATDQRLVDVVESDAQVGQHVQRVRVVLSDMPDFEHQRIFPETALKLDYVPAVLWRELERPRNRLPAGAFLFNLI
jgi:hypothetical protein